MTAKPLCPDCGYIHTPSMVHAIGRFDTTSAPAFRAIPSGPDATPMRSTREAAEADLCKALQRRQEADDA